MSVYRTCVGSTQDGKSICRVCNSVAACRGFGAFVDTAYTTSKETSLNTLDLMGCKGGDVPATGWFHPSAREGT